MPIPKFDQLFLPVLQVLQSGETYKTSDLPELILQRNFFTINSTERAEQTPSGANLFNDRVSWAKSYLKQGKFVSQPNRGLVQITQKGKSLLQSGVKVFELEQLKKDTDFRTYSPQTKATESKTKVEELSPQDLVNTGFKELQQTLKNELLERLLESNPYYFERIVLILFKRMGYGDFRETPKSGDGGIDGVINQDQLGLERIYIQAKRYALTHKVREPEIRNFIGAMSGDVNKGVFVTTSDFDQAARKKAAEARNHTMILIDGELLASLMIKYSVGVQIKATYEVKEIDEDFFELS